MGMFSAPTLGMEPKPWDIPLDGLAESLEINATLEGISLPEVLGGELAEEILAEEVDGLEVVVTGIAFGGIEETVGRDVELLGDATGVVDLSHVGVEEVLGATTLGADEEVGSSELGNTSVDETTLLLEEELLLELGGGEAVGEDVVDEVLLVVATLEHITGGIEEAVVTVVSSVGLITSEEGHPLRREGLEGRAYLDIGHGGGAGVGKVIDGDHGAGEGEHVVLGDVHDLGSLFGSADSRAGNGLKGRTWCYGRRIGTWWGHRNLTCRRGCRTSRPVGSERGRVLLGFRTGKADSTKKVIWKNTPEHNDQKVEKKGIPKKIDITEKRGLARLIGREREKMEMSGDSAHYEFVVVEREL